VANAQKLLLCGAAVLGVLGFSALARAARMPPPPPSPVVVPTGWKLAKGAVTPELTAFAVDTLHGGLAIDNVQTKNIDGQVYGAWTTWHYDDHTTGTLCWHRGITLLVTA
jgi:hypothetical protein